MTEINVTSPTGIREVQRFGGADIAACSGTRWRRSGRAELAGLDRGEDGRLRGAGLPLPLPNMQNRLNVEEAAGFAANRRALFQAITR